jgi:hypothetical protein
MIVAFPIVRKTNANNDAMLMLYEATFGREGDIYILDRAAGTTFRATTPARLLQQLLWFLLNIPNWGSGGSQPMSIMAQGDNMLQPMEVTVTATDTPFSMSGISVAQNSTPTECISGFYTDGAPVVLRMYPNEASTYVLKQLSFTEASTLQFRIVRHYDASERPEGAPTLQNDEDIANRWVLIEMEDSAFPIPTAWTWIGNIHPNNRRLPCIALTPLGPKYIDPPPPPGVCYIRLVHPDNSATIYNKPGEGNPIDFYDSYRIQGSNINDATLELPVYGLRGDYYLISPVGQQPQYYNGYN